MGKLVVVVSPLIGTTSVSMPDWHMCAYLPGIAVGSCAMVLNVGILVQVSRLRLCEAERKSKLRPCKPHARWLPVYDLGRLLERPNPCRPEGDKTQHVSRLLQIEVGLMCCVGAALMQDQARSFQSRGLRADYLSSSRTTSEQEAILKRLQASKLGLQLLLTTPESFGTDRQCPNSQLFSIAVMGDVVSL